MLSYKVGIDIGSTTVKLVVLDEENSLIYSEYKRHLSDSKSTLINIINNCYSTLGDINLQISITGSGGLSVSKWLGINFVQEVIACAKAVETYIPETDVVIELGGEDAKITYFKGGMEQRMNGSCAGGTGAFIDQMAVLLNTDAKGLNEYAKKYKVIYPIASRCGVFAKSDVQPLINDGAEKEDIAASILQAVVNQTIGGLACGKPIRGKVAFLGGPLCFLPELRKRFMESLKLTENDAIIPKYSQLYAAIGTALLSDKENSITLCELVNRAEGIKDFSDEEVKRLKPLFCDEQEYKEFLERHNQTIAKKGNLSEYKGSAYLGIDAGSTTTKAVLIGENDELLYSNYGSNEGNPLKKTIAILKDLYEKLPSDTVISKCSITGYGEALIKAAIHADIGEIETVAHYKAAEHFLPGVDFILDIGGQDMKCLKIKDGAIDSILLNEACSSGCGSFLEGFAASLNMSAEEFAKEALFSKAPADLGTKCTVFMNSKVKQAQKEGAEISDLSAGLSYSVIKNALYKVIKIRNENDLGTNIIVQGGTFYNDAVLRSFELISGREAVRPDIAGLMGAFGAALIAKERCSEGEKSKLLTKELLSEFASESSNRRCGKCQNQCLLTVNKFSDGETFVAGNRCERGLDLEKTNSEKMPDLNKYKYQRTFNYTPLEAHKAKRGVIGIPRALNMYENYPFWFTLLTELGFSVILSAPSSKKIYEKGLESIPSESVCYPAKLCHGHIMELIGRGISTIFYPCVVFEKTEYNDTANHYNCPVVISYPEVIKGNIDEIKKNNIRLISPFLSLDNEKVLVKRIVEEFIEFNVTAKEAKMAVTAAFEERERYKTDIRKKGEETLLYLKNNNKKGIVLCGKPYHIDPEISHGISDLITSYGMAVLTEDSISHLTELKYKLRVVDQWVYNSRLYRAASLVVQEPCLELIQLNSFGCGLDAVTTDQISELLASGGKMYTMLKIDEGNNLGAAKIRIRSLKAAVEERERRSCLPKGEDTSYHSHIFTKEMRKTHTILVPQMAPYHFELIQEAARASGYNMEVLPAEDSSAVSEGLKYVNNDACYPAIIVIGQIIKALKSGKYDVNNTSVIYVQTGGGCRATNYIALLKLGLKKAGYENVPIISINAAGLEKQPGFSVSAGLLSRIIMSLIYGDLFMKVIYRTRPYEKVSGSVQMLYEKWNSRAKENVINGNRKIFGDNIRGIINDFDSLELIDIQKPKVGIVGEIFLKYNPTANNDIVGILEQEGAEAVVPDLTDFLLYCTYNSKFRYKYLAGDRYKVAACDLAASYIMKYRDILKKELDKSNLFQSPVKIEELAEMTSGMVSLGNQTGEGWLVAAEMIEFIKHGVSNVVCAQPLACLPNHAMGKGVIKPVKEKFPEANIIPIDYDPGISSVNQLNRIKLMLSVAEKNLNLQHI